MSYTHGTISASDPNQKPLGFCDDVLAQKHADLMNILRNEWDVPDSIWDKQYWITQPAEWKVVKL